MTIELRSLMKELCRGKAAEISRNELRVKARENLVKKFGKNFQDEDCRTLKQKPEILESEDGHPSKINSYYSNTRKYEKEEIEKQKIRDYIGEVRPQTDSQELIDKYFPSKVPIGEKRPIYGWVSFEGQRPPIVGYKRETFFHSSLRDTVGLYHSLLLLEKESGNISEYNFRNEIRKLETYLDSLDPKSCYISNSVHDLPRLENQRYRNISTIPQLIQEIESTQMRK
ncbi:MAG: hypothetical protein LAT82_00695 [Nanoarchaeota archaeon]|nr:hypothetical protein [Nanoarchaeota archaeon]